MRRGAVRLRFTNSFYLEPKKLGKIKLKRIKEMIEARCLNCGQAITSVNAGQINCGGLPPSRAKAFVVTCPKCHTIIGMTLLVDNQPSAPSRR